MGPLNAIAALVIEAPWSPAYPGSSAWVAISLMAIVLVMALGAMVWTIGSGPATGAEARTLTGSINSGWGLAMSILALIVPLALAITTWFLVFPVSHKSAVCLISREARTEQEAQTIRQRVLREAGTVDHQLLDAGPVVDRVLARLQGHALIPGNADDLNTARTVCFEEVDRIGDVSSLKCHRLGDLSVNYAAASTLPQWVVESVELACCRLLVERADVRQAIIGNAGRLDAYGESTWSDADAYLTASNRIKPGDVCLFAPPAIDVPKLLYASRLTSSVGRCLILLTFQLPASPVLTKTVEFQLEASDDKKRSRPASQTLKLTLEKTESLITVSEDFPWPVSSAKPVSVHAKPIGGGQESDAQVADVGTPSAVILDGATWPPELTATAQPSSWMTKVRVELDRLHSLPQLLVKGDGSDFTDTAVTAKFLENNRGVWLYVAGAGDPQTPAVGGSLSLTPWSIDMPGYSVWSADLYQPQAVRPQAPVSARRVVVGTASGLVSGNPTTQGNYLLEGPPRPDANSATVVVLPDSRSLKQSVVWVGLPNQAEWKNTAYAAAYWWTLVRASSLCLSPPPVEASASRASSRPVLLPSADNLQAIQAATFKKGTIWLSACLATCGLSSFTLAVCSKGRRR